MVTLSDILDVDLLASHVQAGLVSKRPHNSLPLSIYNYTPECQWLRKWDEVTVKTRGLIVNDETGEIVARPFEKFFNWDESGQPYPPTGPVVRMPKMDGSLGILYQYGEIVGSAYKITYGMATRGSLHSEQAEWASQFMSRSDSALMTGEFVPFQNKTYLFEIIYPQNRIVVDYGDYEGLFLLDVIDNETGLSDLDEFDNCGWPEKVNRMALPGFDVMHAADIPEGDEGFVYLWPERNFRTKMKSADYVLLHRLISNLNEKTIWEQLVDGKTVDDIKQGLPEEFHGFVDKTAQEIMNNAYRIVLDATDEFNNIMDSLPAQYSRGDFAQRAVKSEYKMYLFLMLDKKPIYPVALRASKPKRVTILVDDEE